MQEKASLSFLETSSSTPDVISTMQKIYKPNQLVFYYAGGLRALATLLNDSKTNQSCSPHRQPINFKAIIFLVTQKTLFRTNGGFDFHSKHSVISKYFESRCNRLKPTFERIVYFYEKGIFQSQI
jgi:hypothetical protein